MTRASEESLQTKPLTIYFRDISDCKGLPASEEAALSAKIRTGDRKALEKMVRANLRFVVKVAMHYQHLGMELADLISAGNVGLIEAARRFDETRNFKFVSYAVWWIRQAILKELAEQSRAVTIPLSRTAVLYKILKAEKNLEQRCGRLPDVDEIAAELRMGREEVEETISAFTGQSSLDGPIDGQEETCLHDALPDTREDVDHTVVMRSMLHLLNQALEELDKRERMVVKLHFGINQGAPATLHQIGQACNVSGERARQVCQHAVGKLRRYCYDKQR